MLGDLLDGYGRDALSDEDVEVRMPAYLLANAIARRDGELRTPLAVQRARSFILQAASRDLPDLVRSGAPSTPPPEGDGGLQILVAAVQGRTEEQIAAFATDLGGFDALCGMVFAGWKATLRPGAYTVAFALGEGGDWVVDGRRTKVSARKGSADDLVCGAVVHLSPHDFLRTIVRDLDVATAMADGRFVIDGDADQVGALFGLG
jgi:hypothetical protein